MNKSSPSLRGSEAMKGVDMQPTVTSITAVGSSCLLTGSAGFRKAERFPANK